jgi:hypothetical protein
MLLLLLLLLATVAAAGWKAPKNLSAAGEDGNNADVASSQSGATIVAWQHFDGTQPPNTCCDRIEARFKSRKGGFGPVKVLSAGGQNAGSPRVAIGPDGTAVVAWTRLDGTEPPFSCCRRVQVRVRRPGHGFGPLQTLSAAGQDAMDLDVGVGSDGRAVAMWTREQTEFGDRRLQTRLRAPDAGAAPAFRKLQTLSPPGGSAYAPHLGVARDGSATIVWQRYDGTHDRTVASVRRAGGKFKADFRYLSRPNDEADYHTVAVSPNGRTLAAWLVETAGIEYELEVRTRGRRGPFGPIQKLTGAASSGDPAVAVDAAGRATVLWDQLTGTGDRIAVRTRSGSSFGPRKFLTPVDYAVQSPVLAAASGGTTIAAWRHDVDPGPFCCLLAEARIRRPHSGKFGARHTLSSGGQNADGLVLGAGPGRAGIAVWDRFDGSDDRVQAALFKP